MQNWVTLKLFPNIINPVGTNSCFQNKYCGRTGWLVLLEGSKGCLA